MAGAVGGKKGDAAWGYLLTTTAWSAAVDFLAQHTDAFAQLLHGGHRRGRACLRLGQLSIDLGLVREEAGFLVIIILGGPLGLFELLAGVAEREGGGFACPSLIGISYGRAGGRHVGRRQLATGATGSEEGESKQGARYKANGVFHSRTS